VARTLADLDGGRPCITRTDVTAALMLRVQPSITGSVPA
jgi:hypothetical protein